MIGANSRNFNSKRSLSSKRSAKSGPSAFTRSHLLTATMMLRPARSASPAIAPSWSAAPCVASTSSTTADIVVLLVDATQGAADQDGAIAGEAERAGRSIIVAVNKWDLVKAEGPDFAERFDDKLRFELKFLEFAPIIHISALTGERTPKLL